MTTTSIEHTRIKYAVHVTAGFVGLLWFIKAIELATQANYVFLGILPRTLRGSIGIVTAPLIHDDFIHLISNTIPLLLLGIMLFYFYSKFALEVFLWIYGVSGIWTWLFARNSYHLGASGLVYGIAAFLFFSGIIRHDRPLMTISAVILFLYGSMLYGIFPGLVDANVSWESHFTGALSGTILAFLFRNAAPGPEEKPISAEAETPDDDAFFTKPDSTGDIDATYIYKDSTNTKS
jgi:membrane associated rhomboid family serine protease